MSVTYDIVHKHILIVNLLPEYRSEWSSYMGREDKHVKQHYYVTLSQKLSHTSGVLSCSLVYFICGLSTDMDATAIS